MLVFTFVICLISPVAPLVNAQIKLGSQIEQEKQARKGVLFGIQLSPPATKLLREVERAFARPLRQSLAHQGTSYEAGAAGIESDGTPVIALNGEIGKREDVIVHELFHLKLIAEGFHEIHFVPSPGMDNAAFGNLANVFLTPMISSQIQHSVFYPRMRRMKLDPAFDQREFWQQALSGAPQRGDPTGIRRVWGLLYFKAATQMEDPVLMKRIAAYYRHSDYDDALKLGMQLETLYVQSSPLNPSKALKLVVEFCNLIFSDSFTFNVIAEGPERRGSYLFPMAYIQLNIRTDK